MHSRLESFMVVTFGLGLLGLALFVTAETLLRKFVGYSLQGASELSGYVLAIGGSLAFSIALLGRSHVRIDVFYGLLPDRMCRFLDVLSSLALVALASFLLWAMHGQFDRSLELGNRSPTPWRTPLYIPQGLTLIGLSLFFALSLWNAAQSAYWFAIGHHAALKRAHAPKTVHEELADEAPAPSSAAVDVDITRTMTR